MLNFAYGVLEKLLVQEMIVHIGENLSLEFMMIVDVQMKVSSDIFFLCNDGKSGLLNTNTVTAERDMWSERALRSVVEVAEPSVGDAHLK